jgi:hypothetical protein
MGSNNLAIDLHPDGNAGRELRDLVVEKGRSPLYRVRHLHAVTQEIEDEVVQLGVSPKVQGLIQGIAVPQTFGQW